MKNIIGLAVILPLLAAAVPAFAQQASPGSCTASKAELEANRKAAMEFFRRGITPAERIALIDPSYIQHNPRFKKYATDHKLSDYDGFKAMVAQGAGASPAPAAAAPQPPAGEPFAVVTAECDLVTIVHKNFRQDPTAAPGTWYEAFTFDTFRVKNGKLVEHWDAAVLAPPGG